MLDRLAELATTDERAKAERAEVEIAKLEHDLEEERRAYLLLRESGLTEQAEQHKMNSLRHLVALDIRRAKAAGKVTALGGPGRAPNADETVAVGRTDRTELPEEKRAQDQKNPPLDFKAVYLIDKVRGALSWHIGFVGYGIAAGLVSAALDVPVSKWQVLRAIKKVRDDIKRDKIKKARDDIERRRLTLCLMRNHRQLHRCVVVDRSVRFGDGTYPEVVRPSAQPTLSKKLHE